MTKDHFLDFQFAGISRKVNYVSNLSFEQES